MDKETKKLESDIIMIKNTLDTPGWGVIEDRITKLISDLCDFREVGKDLKPEERIRLLEVREGASELVEKWLESIKGDAEWGEEKAERTLTDEIYNK